MQTKVGSKLKFPNGFKWGVATSAHQIEGGLTNDWTEWEKANAARLADKESRNKGRTPGWSHLIDEIIDPSSYISGRSIDHWNNYEKDFQLLKDLNLNSYRFSIEWSRVEPKKGEFDEAAIEQYADMITLLQDLGIELFITLWHWTFPTWISDMGGWTNSETVDYFEKFVEKLLQRLPKVKFWITLNEPEIYARHSYLIGLWPPMQKNPFNYFRVINNLVHANHRAGKTIKAKYPESKIGIAKNNTYFQPYKNWWINKQIVRPFNWWWNRYFLDKVSEDCDFIGLNYYFHRVLNVFGYAPNIDPVSDMGSELGPYGIFHTLMDLKRYDMDIYITENGLADALDTRREWFIKQILMNMHEAMANGVRVKGYFHWSLVDNFEWDKGYWPKFGLYSVDRRTQVRKARGSAKYYADIAENNSLTV